MSSSKLHGHYRLPAAARQALMQDGGLPLRMVAIDDDSHRPPSSG
jgi:hypothetical protein